MFELFWYGITHFIKEWVLLPFNLVLGIGSYAILFGLGMLLLHSSKHMEYLAIVRIQKIFAFILFSVPISIPIIYGIAFSMNVAKNQTNIDNDIKNIGEHYYEVENKDTFILNDTTYIRFKDSDSVEIHATDNCKAILKYDDSVEEAPINHYMYIYETTNNSRFDIIAVKYISNKSKDKGSTWYYVEQPYSYHKQIFNNPIEKYTDTTIFPTKEDITTYPESYTFDDINLVKCYISDEIVSYTDDRSSVLERNTEIIRNSDEFALDWFDTISFNFDPTFKVQDIDKNNQIYHLDIVPSDYNAHDIYMTTDIYWIGPSKQKGSYYIDNHYFENND